MNNKNYTDEEIKILLDEKNIPLSLLSEELMDNKKFMMEAVKRRGSNIYYVSDRLKNDKDLVLEAAKENSISIIYSALKLIEDDSFMLSYLEIVTQQKREKNAGNIDLVKVEKILKKILLNNTVNKIVCSIEPEIFTGNKMITIAKNSDILNNIYNSMNKLIMQRDIKLNDVKSKKVKF